MLVEHGQSVSNAGLRTVRPHLTELTSTGEAQARLTAEALPEPRLIALSPYHRARATAQPFIERWPSAPCVEWPLQEFTFLDPTAWDGTTAIERRPAAGLCWERRISHYAESQEPSRSRGSSRGVDRVRRDALAFGEGPVVAFTHGLFSKVLIWRCTDSTAAATVEGMARARAFARSVRFPNCGIVRGRLEGDGSTFEPADTSHLPPELLCD
ncbi:MAG: phosphoglycerate mutase family protein [Ignavibacteriales bacterium]|nr:phosphoglycerate mutase family protein [Ignavibacteriales bacterium]